MIRALTILQPWCSAITLASKRIENRTWFPPPGALPIGGWLVLHAGGNWYQGEARARAVLDELRDTLWPDAPALDVLPRGAFLGVARLVEVYPWGRVRRPGTAPDPWAAGPVCWRLGDVRALRTPIPVRGAQGLWRLPPGTLRQLQADPGLAGWTLPPPPAVDPAVGWACTRGDE